jgi:hypothetical protein
LQPGSKHSFISGVPRERNWELKDPETDEAVQNRHSKKYSVLKNIFLNRQATDFEKINRNPHFLQCIKKKFHQRLQQTIRHCGKHLIGIIFKK